MGKKDFGKRETKKVKKGGQKTKTDTILTPSVTVEVIKKAKKPVEFEE